MIKPILISLLAILFIFAVSSKQPSTIGATNINIKVLGDLTVDSAVYLPKLTVAASADTAVTISGGRLTKTVIATLPSVKTDTFITATGNTSFLVAPYKIVSDILVLPNSSVSVKAGLTAGGIDVFDTVVCSPVYPFADIQPINGVFSKTQNTRVYITAFPSNISVTYRIVWR